VARLIAFSFLASTLLTGHNRAALHGSGLVMAVVGGACLLTWFVWSVLAWVLPASAVPAATVGCIAVFGALGAFLTGIAPQTSAAVFPAAACLTASARIRVSYAAPFVAGLIAITLATSVLANHLTSGFGYSALLFGMFGVGLGRRSYVLRAETAEQLVVETERFNAERAHAAALAERGRIAREIHDVLAHSLSALTVQLEVADALLAGGRDPERAHDHVITARRIAREGLAETRRAIAALREDAPPLRALLKALADSYSADTGAQAAVCIDAEPEGVPTDAGLAIYRTAQESLTNVRKHAPGADVSIALRNASADTICLTIENAHSENTSPLATSGGGYGLTGLRERAELAGGTLEAGPHDGGWRVRLTVPAQSPPTLGA
jgi:signal transduction histidine kinase